MNWRKGPSQGDETEVYDGDIFLVALRVTDDRTQRTRWEYSVGRTTEEGTETFDGDGWGWEWRDVDWYVPIGDLTPPDPAA